MAFFKTWPSVTAYWLCQPADTPLCSAEPRARTNLRRGTSAGSGASLVDSRSRRDYLAYWIDLCRHTGSAVRIRLPAEGDNHQVAGRGDDYEVDKDPLAFMTTD